MGRCGSSVTLNFIYFPISPKSKEYGTRSYDSISVFLHPMRVAWDLWKAILITVPLYLSGQENVHKKLTTFLFFIRFQWFLTQPSQDYLHHTYIPKWLLLHSLWLLLCLRTLHQSKGRTLPWQQWRQDGPRLLKLWPGKQWKLPTNHRNTFDTLTSLRT